MCLGCGLDDFDTKIYLNRKKKNVWFSLVRLTFRNQTKSTWFELVSFIRFFTRFLHRHTYTYIGQHNFFILYDWMH